VKRKTRNRAKCKVTPMIHTDAVGQVIDRMLSGVYNPRTLNPEDDLIDAIDRKAALLDMVRYQDLMDMKILMLRIVGASIRAISKSVGLPRSTVHDRLKRMTWARPILEQRPEASDLALIGEATRGLHGVKRDRVGDGIDHKAWISLGNGGYRKRGHGGSDGTQNG
jgi:hypothetical protein